jgi:hypothetical protein
MTLSPHRGTIGGDQRIGSHSQPSRVVSLGSEVDLVGLQNCMVHFKPAWTARETICVDLQECRKFDVIALLHLLAAAAARSRLGAETRFRLPSDEVARQYLRMWRFSSAVGRVTETPFRLLVDGQDGLYFGEEEPAVFPAESSDVSTEIVQYLTQQSFFGFSSYDLSSEDEPFSLLETEPHRWRNPLVLRLLQKHLKSLANDVPRVIVQELLVAVTRHVPAASVILASQLDVPEKRPDFGSPYLTIGVWCDSDWATRVIADCRLIAKDVDAAADRSHNRGFLARFVQMLSTQNADLGANGSPSTDDPSYPTTQDRGLAALCRTVVEGFGGTIEVKARTATLTISRSAESEETAAALATRSTQSLPTFLGSLVEVRVPVGR